MIRDKFKKIIVYLTVIVFITTTFFGFVFMIHMTNGDMESVCPFSATGTTLCPQNSLSMVLYHIGTFDNFLNIPVPSLYAQLILLLITIISVSLPFDFIKYLFYPPLKLGKNYIEPFKNIVIGNIISWLSFFENSPSFK